MLANRRFCFLLFVLAAFLLAAWLPLAGQIHGVPPSVTSFGFGGSDNPTPGIRASVTSLGPYGYGPPMQFLGNCCGSLFWQSGFWPSNTGPRPDRRRRHHDDATVVPLLTPVYVPYGVPYASDEDEEAADSSDAYAAGPGAPQRDDSRRSARRDVGPDRAFKDSAPSDPGSEGAAPEQPEEQVVAQPATVLVFKDGHRSEVVNYAIVGNTLFDFAGGRTRKIMLADLDLPATQKANDELGVEFKLPPTSK